MRYRGSRRWRGKVQRHFRSLFQMAEQVAPHDPDLAQRYMRMAQRIVIRTRVRLPPEFRHRFCHRCGRYFRPGINVRIRLRTAGRKSSVVMTCLMCGYRRKLFWTRKNKGRNKKSDEHDQL